MTRALCTRGPRALWMGLWLALLALGTAPAGADGNLLPNPDFDTNLDGWTSSGGVFEQIAVGWPTGVFTPGSARCITTNASASLSCTLTAACRPVEPQTRDELSRYAFILTAACLPVEPQTRYELSLYAFIPTGQATTGTVYPSYSFYSDANCANNMSGVGALGISTPGTLWQLLPGWLNTPAGAHSLRLSVQVNKDQAGGSFEARVDGLYLGPAAKGDFNGDGRADLLFDDLASDQHLVWYMARERQAAAASLSPGGPGTDWKLSATDDFDGDRKTDVVFRNPTTGVTQFWLLNGVVAKPLHPLLESPPSTDWELTAAADFNHDQKPDLLWRNTVTQKLQVWTMNGTAQLGTLVPTPDQAVNANWACVAALDLNKDGHPDLLWYNATTGKIVYWLMDADLQRITGNFTSPSNAGNNNWKVVAAGDYARQPSIPLDSVDIVWRNETSGKLVMWYMDSFGVRVGGGFTSPDSPQPALGWNVLGPR